MRRLAVVATCVVAVLVPSASSYASLDLNAEHQTSAFDDCRFSSWYDVTQPLHASGQLEGVVDARCAGTHQIELDLTVTDGEADASAAAGPANPLVGISEADPTGITLSSQRTHVDASTGAALDVTLPAPPDGAVYTVDAIMKFTDACANWQCNPPPPVAPDAPWMPGNVAPLGEQSTVCMPEHDGTFDVDCEWQFTVVGRAAPVS